MLAGKGLGQREVPLRRVSSSAESIAKFSFGLATLFFVTYLVVIDPHKLDLADTASPAKVTQGLGGVLALGEGNESSPASDTAGEPRLKFQALAALDRPAPCFHLT